MHLGNCVGKERVFGRARLSCFPAVHGRTLGWRCWGSWCESLRSWDVPLNLSLELDRPHWSLSGGGNPWRQRCQDFIWEGLRWASSYKGIRPGTCLTAAFAEYFIQDWVDISFTYQRLWKRAAALIVGWGRKVDPFSPFLEAPPMRRLLRFEWWPCWSLGLLANRWWERSRRVCLPICRGARQGRKVPVTGGETYFPVSPWMLRFVSQVKWSGPGSCFTNNLCKTWRTMESLQ